MGRTINFMDQLTEHIIWNIRLRCFLDGGECISEEQAVFCEKCTLGKWLHEEGLKNTAIFPQLMSLKEFIIRCIT